MIKVFREGAAESNSAFIGKNQQILVEGMSKRSSNDVYGRNDANIKVIIPLMEIPSSAAGEASTNRHIEVGDLVMVNVTESNSQVLKGQPLYHCNELI
ncbi:hypothetical protein HA402_005571 [Bradysia odoriphaga]|nr:hypothetical protein HA402_005571 [Bradysia odoriphaga]